MYVIKKIPAPRGYKILNREIPVSFIIGAEQIYDNDGELMANYTGEIDNKPIRLEVKYKIIYNDGTERDFVAYELIRKDKTEYSLSKAPVIMGTKKYVTEINIEVSRIGSENDYIRI